MPKTDVVIASGNKGKIRELQHRLGDAFQLIPQTELGVIAPEETGKTFLENALLKARAACKQTGLPAIADDSGLAVEALDGAPGIYSARYAGVEASDTDNNKKLLKALDGISNAERQAAFHCALVYMSHDSDPTPIVACAAWRGRILSAPSGSNGFGYDPLFYATEQQSVSAELPPEIKNRVSHRGQAIDRLVAQLAASPPRDAP